MKFTPLNQQMKFWGGLTLIVIIIAGIAVWKSRQDGITSHNGNTVTITTSFYPLAEFAQKVGGEHVTAHQSHARWR
jgi:ABC-type Zn uptake system ZnuABC Zn-binding protein ZnuA